MYIFAWKFIKVPVVEIFNISICIMPTSISGFHQSLRVEISSRLFTFVIFIRRIIFILVQLVPDDLARWGMAAGVSRLLVLRWPPRWWPVMSPPAAPVGQGHSPMASGTRAGTWRMRRPSSAVSWLVMMTRLPRFVPITDADWSRQVTWPRAWPLIGQGWVPAVSVVWPLVVVLAAVAFVAVTPITRPRGQTIRSIFAAASTEFTGLWAAAAQASMLCFVWPRGLSPFSVDLLGDVVDLSVPGLAGKALEVVVVVWLVFILVNSQAKLLPQSFGEILPRLGFRFRSWNSVSGFRGRAAAAGWPRGWTWPRPRVRVRRPVAAVTTSLCN